MSDSKQMELLEEEQNLSVSMSLPAGSRNHVRISPLQETKREWVKAHGRAYGQSARVLLGRFVPGMAYLKTCQLSFLGEEPGENGFNEFSSTFPRSGMMRNGTVYQLPNLALTTTEIGSGLFATPDCQNHRDGSSSRGVSLHHHVAMWPTPRTTDAYTAASKRKIQGHPKAQLREQVFWATPTVNDSKNSTFPESQKNRSSLIGDVMRLPTPTARDYKGARSTESLERAGRDGTNSLPDAFAVSKTSARLNPLFVEVLMGYPITHTDLKD